MNVSAGCGTLFKIPTLNQKYYSCRQIEYNPWGGSIWRSSILNLCDKVITLERKLNQTRPLLSYQTHIGWKGWLDWKDEGQLSSPRDQEFDIQAIKINHPTHKVYYSVYYNENEGWSKEVSNAQMAGTTGQKKSIYGIRIRLDEIGAKEFDILYRVHKFDGTWTDWAKNGEALYSFGQKLNAIQIKLVIK